MKHALTALLPAILWLSGCDAEEHAAASQPVTEAAPSSDAAQDSAQALDPMTRLSHKGLYSQMDPMVALRSWENVTGSPPPARHPCSSPLMACSPG